MLYFDHHKCNLGLSIDLSKQHKQVEGMVLFRIYFCLTSQAKSEEEALNPVPMVELKCIYVT